MPTDTERMLRERLAQRTAALGRVAAENGRLRAALLAVLGAADIHAELVRCDEVHDAIGGELIAELLTPGQPPGREDEWRDPEPVTLMGIQDAINKILGIDHG